MGRSPGLPLLQPWLVRTPPPGTDVWTVGRCPTAAPCSGEPVTHTRKHTGDFYFFRTYAYMRQQKVVCILFHSHKHSARGVGVAGRERVQGQPSLCFLPASTKPTTCLGRPAESLPSAPRLPAALLILLLSISSASLTAHSGACRVCCMGLIGSVR